ncbi:cyclohexanecarboxylate-CoA ligase [Brevibacterium sandarakinum]|uniref:Cyclohexanecarboxylate-CoA ligase n=1 Tax=Brevibacterium sandarakinum TaxID=629680 RepID=A0A1H1RQS5_BRESA|nr:AMP-binding protein [Brevibacterium sandarakinum]SDS38050.1 cyclohexanecarboxylate-CoA ligase [Brevibacterium sandarakinum]
MPTRFDTTLTDALIKEHTSTGAWENKTLLDHLEHWTAERPDSVVSRDPYGSHTYRELSADAEACARALVDLGVQTGEVVGIHLPNWYEWLVIHLGALKAGAVTNGLIPIYRDREIGYMAQKAAVTVLFVPNRFRKFDYPDMVDRLRDGLPDLRHTIVLDAPGEEPFTSREGLERWSDFLGRGTGGSPRSAGSPGSAEAAASIDWDARRPDPNDVGLILFTSGTTGDPKGVMHTHNSVLSASLPWPDHLGLGTDSVIHMASTFGHLTGYMYGVCLPLLVGGSGVFQDLWNGEEFARLIEELGIEHTSGATPFLHDLIEAAKTTDRDLSSLKHFCCMGAPIPRVMVHEAKELLPNLNVFGGWGQTECGLVTMTAPGDSDDKVTSTDGRALGDMQVRIVDPLGEPVSAGSEGKVQVKGPFLFVGYLSEPKLTDEAFDGAWLDTGDIAEMDAQGFIKIGGRSKDIIIRGGENIPVAYVENIMYEHPAVSQVAIVAVPHPRLQEIACAVVTLREGHSFTLDELREFFASKGVTKHYWPETLQVLDEFPRTPSGKIQKFKLREEVVGRHDK